MLLVNGLFSGTCSKCKQVVPVKFDRSYHLLSDTPVLVTHTHDYMGETCPASEQSPLEPEPLREAPVMNWMI